MRDEEKLNDRYRERLEQLDRNKALDWMLSSVVTVFTVRMDQLRNTAERYDESSDTPPESVRDARSQISRDRRRRIEAAVDSFMSTTEDQVNSEIAALDLDEDSEAPPVVLHHEANALVALLLLGPENLAELAEPLESSISSGAELELAMSYLGWKSALRAPSAILDACIPAAVTEFETLLAALLRIGQTVHPEGLGAGKKPTTIAEVEASGGIELARARAVDRAARDIVDSSPYDWRKRLAKWPGIDPAELVPSWDPVAEIFRRRNVLVHAGGRADEECLRHQSPTEGAPRLGQPLHCTRDYVLTSIDTLYTVARGLAARWLPTLLPDASFDAYGDSEAVLHLLSTERWDLATSLSGAFIDHSSTADHVMQVNNWMARSELAGSAEVIRDEVERWAPPDEGVRWEVARAALLGQSARVRSLLEQDDSHSLTVDCAGWPLLKRLRRADPQLDVWLLRHSRQERRRR